MSFDTFLIIHRLFCCYYHVYYLFVSKFHMQGSSSFYKRDTENEESTRRGFRNSYLDWKSERFQWLGLIKLQNKNSSIVSFCVWDEKKNS